MTYRLISFAILLSQTSSEIDPEAAEFNLFLFLLLIFAAVVVFIVFVIGVLVALAIAFAGGFLVFSGAAITSLLHASLRHSPSSGVTLFIVQLTWLAGSILGCATGMLYSHMNDLELMNMRFTGYGTLAGALAGSLIGWVSAWLLIGAFNHLQLWWASRKDQSTPVNDTQISTRPN